MRIQWMTAAVLSSALLVGCTDRSAQTGETLNENGTVTPEGQPGTGGVANAPAAVAPAPASSPNRDVQPAQPRRAPAGSVANGVDTRADESERAPITPRVAAAPAPRAQWREVTLPAGTSLPLELTTALSSETATVEAPVRARLRQAVTVDGVTVIPAGTILVGEVTDVARPGRVQGRARLTIAFNEATVNGDLENVRTNPLTFEGEATKAVDATKIGAGAGIGAIIGGIVGGGDGAAKGAAIGGAAGTGAVLATRGKDVEVASGADVTATLSSPVTLRVPNR